MLELAARLAVSHVFKLSSYCFKFDINFIDILWRLEWLEKYTTLLAISVYKHISSFFYIPLHDCLLKSSKKDTYAVNVSVESTKSIKSTDFYTFSLHLEDCNSYL